jgi:hypothetical protein
MTTNEYFRDYYSKNKETIKEQAKLRRQQDPLYLEKKNFNTEKEKTDKIMLSFIYFNQLKLVLKRKTWNSA